MKLPGEFRGRGCGLLQYASIGADDGSDKAHFEFMPLPTVLLARQAEARQIDYPLNTEHIIGGTMAMVARHERIAKFQQLTLTRPVANRELIGRTVRQVVSLPWAELIRHHSVALKSKPRSRKPSWGKGPLCFNIAILNGRHPAKVWILKAEPLPFSRHCEPGVCPLHINSNAASFKIAPSKAAIQLRLSRRLQPGATKGREAGPKAWYDCDSGATTKLRSLTG